MENVAYSFLYTKAEGCRHRWYSWGWNLASASRAKALWLASQAFWIVIGKVIYDSKNSDFISFICVFFEIALVAMS